LNPVSCQYEVGSPLFRNATIHLENGNTFKIVTEGYSPEKYLVKEVLLNGKRLRGTDISHNDIMQGGTLTFVMQ